MVTNLRTIGVTSWKPAISCKNKNHLNHPQKEWIETHRASDFRYESPNITWMTNYREWALHSHSFSSTMNDREKKATSSRIHWIRVSIGFILPKYHSLLISFIRVLLQHAHRHCYLLYTRPYMVKGEKLPKLNMYRHTKTSRTMNNGKWKWNKNWKKSAKNRSKEEDTKDS